MTAGVKTVGHAVGEKVSGGQPGPLRAFAAAAIVGAAAAVVTYKSLRK